MNKDENAELQILEAVEQPDEDTIKMFVGQVPKAWSENQLRNLFEPYGRIHTLNILRDKVTSMSRGKSSLLELSFFYSFFIITSYTSSQSNLTLQEKFDSRSFYVCISFSIPFFFIIIITSNSFPSLSNKRQIKKIA